MSVRNRSLTCRTGREDDHPYKTNLYYRPDRLNDVRLKNRLCTSGPARCAKCMSCLYGQEWLRRHPEARKAD